MLTIDDRCSHRSCPDKGIYRMVGTCGNCDAGPILILITSGHGKPTEALCPVCACWKVRAERMATDDEIPAA